MAQPELAENALMDEPKLDSLAPKGVEFEEYLTENDITQEETEHYFNLVNTYFFSQNIEKYTVSHCIMEDDEYETWISTDIQIKDDLDSEKIHSTNMGLLTLLVEKDISDKAFHHFVTSIY